MAMIRILPRTGKTKLAKPHQEAILKRLLVFLGAFLLSAHPIGGRLVEGVQEGL